MSRKLIHSRLVPALPYVRGYLLDTTWEPVVSRPRKCKENITVLESRAALIALQHTCRYPVSVRTRHLLVLDSMACVLSFSKGRSSTEGLTTVCRRVAALILALDCVVHWRWAPSENNPADEPSRRLDGRPVEPRAPLGACPPRLPGHAPLWRRLAPHG